MISSLLGLAPMVFGMMQLPIPMIVLEENRIAEYNHFQNLNPEQTLNLDKDVDKEDFNTLKEMIEWTQKNDVSPEEGKGRYSTIFDIIIDPKTNLANTQKEGRHRVFRSPRLLALFNDNPQIRIMRTFTDKDEDSSLFINAILNITQPIQKKIVPAIPNSDNDAFNFENGPIYKIQYCVTNISTGKPTIFIKQINESSKLSDNVPLKLTPQETSTILEHITKETSANFTIQGYTISPVIDPNATNKEKLIEALKPIQTPNQTATLQSSRPSMVKIVFFIAIMSAAGALIVKALMRNTSTLLF